ncbi:hypothetical protein ALC56_15163 [Trachymyrmex septentrionalis]|uniref:Uncharacterized protein n=1 Tax=Trachymyrmex septentrionalis TaxID=34720 RepID=A0A195ERD8_9HYME|nr:hypothetical protein ALC56_15163 [Trachymyrmex septentrionalis]
MKYKRSGEQRLAKFSPWGNPTPGRIAEKPEQTSSATATGDRGEEERRKRPRRIGRAYSRGTGPINPRDRCYLFIISLNVDR